jgi:hypothetical protein
VFDVAEEEDAAPGPLSRSEGIAAWVKRAQDHRNESEG